MFESFITNVSKIIPKVVRIIPNGGPLYRYLTTI